MQLKEELTLIQWGNKIITDYLHTVKMLANKIFIIDQPLSDDDLTLHIFHGLGADFREIVAPIRARENSLTFEELHDLLIGHESCNSAASSLYKLHNSHKAESTW